MSPETGSMTRRGTELMCDLPMDVNAYLYDITDLYNWAPPRIMTELRVVKVSLMKNVRRKSKHESLLVELRDPDGGTHYLYFERRGRNYNDKSRPSDPAQPERHAEQLSASTTGSPRNPSSGKSNQRDTVMRAPKDRRPGEKCMCQLEFKSEGSGDLPRAPNEGLFVYNIAVLADTLSKQGPHYDVFNSNGNCYSFGGLLYDMLKKLYHPSETIVRKRRFSLYSHDPEDKIASLVRHYETALEEYQAKIARRHMERNKEVEERVRLANERTREAQERTREAQERTREAQERTREAQEGAREARERAREAQERARKEKERSREIEEMIQKEKERTREIEEIIQKEKERSREFDEMIQKEKERTRVDNEGARDIVEMIQMERKRLEQLEEELKNMLQLEGYPVSHSMSSYPTFPRSPV
uniref:Uncharacterized protein n=1 Tax=Psilocybe cubensis TaxID=181762 RepID=A0A8H7XMR5_PSICU